MGQYLYGGQYVNQLFCTFECFVSLKSILVFFGGKGYLKSCNLKTDFLVDDSLEPSVVGRYCRLTSLARVEVQRLLNN